MKSMHIVVPLLMTMGCSRPDALINRYGETKFVEEMLVVANGGPAPQSLRETFRPIRIEPHLNGAWLVMSEGAGSSSGIYVDRKNVDDWGGSGMDVQRWSQQTAWITENRRKSPNNGPSVQMTRDVKQSENNHRAGSSAPQP